MTDTHQRVIADAVAQLASGRHREYGIRITKTDPAGHVISLFVRNVNGFMSFGERSFPQSTLTESELQDIIASFTLVFVEDITTTQGVQLVLPI